MSVFLQFTFVQEDYYKSVCRIEHIHSFWKQTIAGYLKKK